jgi:type II pantothenate kinase
MTGVPQCKELFDVFSQLYHVQFHVPDLAEYATAIGAALYAE